MNEKLNIAEILKDCPKGTKLYSPIFGEVELEKVFYTSIIVKGKSGISADFYVDGKYHSNGECMLFPSKENRDWSTFQIPFKDGDILFAKSAYSWIFIYKESENKEDLYKYVGIENHLNHSYIVYEDCPLCCKKDVTKIRFATEEEKQKLFDAIKANGYKWNAKTKTLEKLIEPKFKVGDRIKDKINQIIYTIKDIRSDVYIVYTNMEKYHIPFSTEKNFELIPNKFDITTLKPFESRVLVRTSNKWVAAFYSHYDKEAHLHHCVVGGLWYKQCIPYNDETKHLLDTNDDCDDYYKTWE